MQYNHVPLDPQIEKDYRSKRVVIQRLVGQSTLTAQEQQEFDSYFQNYALARWKDLTMVDQTSKFADELSGDLGKGGSSATHQKLVAMAMDFFVPLLKDPKNHPAVHINAMRVIANLNQRDAGYGETPVPLPEAMPVLLEALNDPNQSDGVKVAALVGIIRHVTLDVARGAPDPAVLNNQVVPALLELATATSEPGRSDEGHGWMRALAIEGLAAAKVLGDAQDPAKVPKALTEIVGEEDAPTFTRLAAARALGRLPYKNSDLKLDPTPPAVALGKLAAELATADVERAESEEPANAVASRAMPDFGGYEEEGGYEEGGGGGGGRPPRRGRGARRLFEAPGAATPGQGELTAPLRRRLKANLEPIWLGLVGDAKEEAYNRWTRPEGPPPSHYAGISVLATMPPQQKFVNDLLEQLKKVMDLCDDTNATYVDLVANLKLQVDALNRTVQNPPAVGG